MHFLFGDIGGINQNDGLLQITDGNFAINKNYMSGNWHLVLINACKSGITSEFADALHIRGYSNRGYVGWFDTVTNLALIEWSPYFYQFAGTMSVCNAHLSAANNCQNSTPVRFYGDSSWYGWAW